MSELTEAKQRFESFILDGWQRADGRPNDEFAVTLEHLEVCEDTMPDELCEDLDLPLGSTFTQGVRSIRLTEEACKNLVEQDKRCETDEKKNSN